MLDLLRKPTTLWAIATLILTAVVLGVIVEIINWEQLPKALIISILILGLLVSAGLYYYGYVRYRQQTKSYDKRDELFVEIDIEQSEFKWSDKKGGTYWGSDFSGQGYTRIWNPIVILMVHSKLLVDTIELKMLGREPIPSNWKGAYIIGESREELEFEIPTKINEGKHKVRLLAEANGIKWESTEQVIDFPKR